jgi:hypothetical protein
MDLANNFMFSLVFVLSQEVVHDENKAGVATVASRPPPPPGGPPSSAAGAAAGGEAAPGASSSASASSAAGADGAQGAGYPGYGAQINMAAQYPAYNQHQHQQHQQPQNQHSNNNHQQHLAHHNSNSNKQHTPFLPEAERCTLKITGIPHYISDSDIRAHCDAFGYVVQMQWSAPVLSAANTTEVVGEAEVGADGSKQTQQKKTNRECLVQFYSAANAKKCFSSPKSVLDNRFINIRQSFVNLIPPTDVPYPGDDVIEHDKVLLTSKHNVPQLASAGADAGAAGYRKRQPYPVVAAAHPQQQQHGLNMYAHGASNKYRRTAEDDNRVHTESGAAVGPPGTADGHGQEDSNGSAAHNQAYTGDSNSGGVSSPQPAVMTQEKLEIKAKNEQLKVLRQQMDEISRQKEKILQVSSP